MRQHPGNQGVATNSGILAPYDVATISSRLRMEICLSNLDAQPSVCKALAVGLFSDDASEELARLAQQLGADLPAAARQRRFTAKVGEKLLLFPLPNAPHTVLLLGLGEQAQYALTTMRSAAAEAARVIADHGSAELALRLPLAAINLQQGLLAQAEAVQLTIYQDRRFKSDKEEDQPPKLQSVTIHSPHGDGPPLARASAVCAGVELARQLVAAPPNVVDPTALANTARSLAANHGLKLRLLEKDECTKLGMGAYLGVAEASHIPPQFIHLTYQPASAVKQRLVLVGKGLTFDSGGYNLKVGAAQIEMMKFDMGGCAAVLGAARAIAELQPQGVEVHFISATCENMISGAGLRPGDILKASNGTTIEVNNTDAEGRLTLADALVYACGLEPHAVVDLATLTGACQIALGDEVAGMWSPNDSLATELLQAAEDSCEGLWRMPLPAAYKDRMKSQFADLKNTGPRAGGAITAALFLQNFVKPEIPWAHIDIAGTVWSEKGYGDNPPGATGYGVRTLVDWVSARATDGKGQ